MPRHPGSGIERSDDPSGFSADPKQSLAINTAELIQAKWPDSVEGCLAITTRSSQRVPLRCHNLIDYPGRFYGALASFDLSWVFR